MVDNYDLWYFHRIDWVIHLERVLFHTFQLTAPNKLGRKIIGPPNDIQKREKRWFLLTATLINTLKYNWFFLMRNCLLKLIRFFLNYILKKYWYDSAISRIFNVKSLSKSTNISKKFRLRRAKIEKNLALVVIFR